MVVKPARGEQGKGVAVGLRGWKEAKTAIDVARKICNEVVVEECVEGMDLRIIVIDYRVVAAAIRRPARVIGDGVTPIVPGDPAFGNHRDLAEKARQQILTVLGEPDLCKVPTKRFNED